MVIAADSSADDAKVEAYERSACPTCGSCSGMFTANSMNCLTEALGLSLPGNGSLLATHADRKALFLEAGRLVVELTRRYYVEDDDRVLPRNIANRAAFENAMSLDIAMGGSTNTILHLLAAAQEAELDFTMADIDTLSRNVPQLCKVAPSTPLYHMEDVHRAGGVLAILGELARSGQLHTDCHTVHSPSIGEAIAHWDIATTDNAVALERFKAGPAGIPTQEAFSQATRWPTLDLDREGGCIRSADNAYSEEGGLAVLFGNIAEDGCVVKTAGVEDELLVFEGRAHVCESQEDAVADILEDRVQAGDVVIVRYEGPRGGPVCRNALSNSYIKSKGWVKPCTDYRRSLLWRYIRLIDWSRFSGSGGGGAIALVENGDRILIDIPKRAINVLVDEAVLNERRTVQAALGFKPAKNRPRKVSPALKFYAKTVTSADRGAVRDLSLLDD